MPTGIRYRRALELELDDGSLIRFDAGPGDGDPADLTVVSHAHGDHLPDAAPSRVACSALTRALAAERRPDAALPAPVDDRRVELVDAGHVAGSRAAVVTDPETGRRYCYTGDVSVRDRFFLDGFEPPDADVLVIEATYGDPGYRFPPHGAVVDDVLRWLDGTRDRPVVLCGYALGRAQQLTWLADRAGRDRVLVTDAVARLNDVVERHRDVALGGQGYEGVPTLGAGDALVVPFSTGRVDWLDDLVDRSDAVTAGFSGWALDDSFVYRRGLDRGFPLSDHCDADELVAVVDAVDPDRVYTHHGAADALARRLADRGHRARSLKPGQAALDAF